jgi:hypothetical protein
MLIIGMFITTKVVSIKRSALKKTIDLFCHNKYQDTNIIPFLVPEERLQPVSTLPPTEAAQATLVGVVTVSVVAVIGLALVISDVPALYVHIRRALRINIKHIVVKEVAAC